MSDFKVFEIAGSALVAQSTRLNTVASNLANADTVASDPSKVFRARHPVFEAQQDTVRVTGVIESERAPLVRYEPGHPAADAKGNVYAPDIDPVEQMVDMIAASRAYQSNLEVMGAAKDLMLATLRLGQ